MLDGVAVVVGNQPDFVCTVQEAPFIFDNSSKPNSLSVDVAKQGGVRIVLRVLPFVEPDRKRRDENSGFEQHIEGNIGHIQFCGQETLMLAEQEHSNVNIAVRAVRAARTTAIDDGPRHVVATGDQREKAANSFFRLMVDSIGYVTVVC